MPVELQSISIFAVSSGFCDKLAVNQIRPFEAALHSHLLAAHKELMVAFRAKPEFDKETEAKFAQIIKSFVDQFLAGAVATAPKGGGTPQRESGGTQHVAAH